LKINKSRDGTAGAKSSDVFDQLGCRQDNSGWWSTNFSVTRPDRRRSGS